MFPTISLKNLYNIVLPNNEQILLPVSFSQFNPTSKCKNLEKFGNVPCIPLQSLFNFQAVV